MSLYLQKTPGPGSYSLDSCFKVNKYKGASFARRVQAPADDDKPGPASYYPQRLTKGPEWKFTKKTFVRPNDSMPGPGTYYESINLIPGGIAEGAAKKKGFSMSGRTRIGTTNDENPGPGTHEVISSFSKTQGVGRNGTGFLFSIKGKYYRPDSEATPGPIYNVIPNASHKGGVAFGRRVRLHGTNDGPGPAAYDPKQIQKKFGMTFGSRLPHSSSTYLGSAQAKSVILKGHGGD